MKTLLKCALAVILSAFFTDLAAQDAEMADSFRADGKIYVVVAIILIVLAGLITYLFLMDRKLTRLEKLLGQKRQTKAEGKSL